MLHKKLLQYFRMGDKCKQLSAFKKFKIKLYVILVVKVKIIFTNLLLT